VQLVSNAAATRSAQPAIGNLDIDVIVSSPRRQVGQARTQRPICHGSMNSRGI
jgi:hypothetical protein